MELNLKFLFSAIMCMFCLSLPEVKCGVPSSFFWKPRLGLFLKMPGSEALKAVKVPPKNPASQINIKQNLVILMDGYQIGVTVLALTTGLEAYHRSYHYLQPTQPYFYTNAYRWGLRYLKALTDVVGRNKRFIDSHKVWRFRFHNSDSVIPKAFRILFPWVSPAQWSKEEEYHRLYKKFAETGFSKGSRFPLKVYKVDKYGQTISEKSIYENLQHSLNE